MAVTYFLTSVASDLTGGADFTNELSETAPGASSVSFSVTTNTTETNLGFTPSGIPGTSGGNGARDYTVTVVITTANADLMLSIQLHRVNSAGVVQSSSSASAEQIFSGGPLTYNFTSLDLGTFAAGDRLRVDFIQRDTTIHGDEAGAYTISSSGTRVDTPFAAPDLSREVTAEGLKLADTPTPTPTLNPLEASLQESVRIIDLNQGVVQLITVLHIADGPVIAELVGEGADLSRAISPDESVKLADIVLTSLDPLEAAVLSEGLRAADTPTAARDLTETLQEDLKLADTLTAARDLTATAQEDLKLADGPAIARTNPDAVVLGPEALLLADVLTAARDLTASVQEGLTPADALTAEVTLATAAADENLKLADFVATTLDPEEASALEALRLADAVTIVLDPLEASAAEALKVGDTLTANVGDLAVAIDDEALRLSDAPAASLDPEEASVAEALKLADVVVDAFVSADLRVGTEAIGEPRIRRSTF